ncbi:Cytochrome c oxidase assembly protein cox18, mitochondrial [Orbilia oligospora]|uniref:Cytochrome c oxidase assembly protein cox18, mitochondrial n=1 Tax=Orbilia oligospora TaxID=2813651 RepID=A0A7C8Q9K6_ORBOL|nr:Cytochrome c oxidase assembly protein cox18, mitochondrial [Orbilia oligospora]
MLRSTTITTTTTTTATFTRHLRHHHLRPLTPSLLSPTNLTTRNGNPITTPTTPRRSFTTTPTIEPLLSTTTSLILTLQSTTSLPWLLTIPLVALTVRTCITLPFTLYSHKRTIKQLSLSPIIHAWSFIYRRQVAKEVYTPTPTSSSSSSSTIPKELIGKKIFNTPEKWTKEVLKRTKNKRVELYKQFGCQYWKGFVGLIQIPVWVLASVSVRRVTGVNGWDAPIDISKRAREMSSPSSPSSSSGLQSGVEGGASTSSSPVLSIPENGTPGLDEITAKVREEMQTGGIDGWFVDLLQPDPYMILPIIFSLTLFTNVMSATARATKEPTGWRKGLRNALMGISLAAFPLTIGSPAVLLLYWITSGTYSLIQNAVLHTVLPPPKSVAPVGEKVPSWLKKDKAEESK